MGISSTKEHGNAKHPLWLCNNCMTNWKILKFFSNIVVKKLASNQNKKIYFILECSKCQSSLPTALPHHFHSNHFTTLHNLVIVVNFSICICIYLIIQRHAGSCTAHLHDSVVVKGIIKCLFNWYSLRNMRKIVIESSVKDN